MAEHWTPRPRPGDVPGGECPARSGSRSTLVAIGAISLLSVGTIVLCIIALVVTLARRNRPIEADLELPAEKQAELRAAFNAPEIGVDAATRQEIEQLFDQIIAATSSSEDAKFQVLVDRDRMFEAMQASGQMPRMWKVDLEAVRTNLPDSLWIPWHATRYRIAHVRLLPGAAEAVVYGYFWTAAGDVAEMRWWLIHRDGAWKPFDWELLQFGTRCSRELALYQQVDTTVYSQIFDDIQEGQAAFNQGEIEKGRQRMRRAERMLPLVPEALRDEARLWTAYYWHYAGYHDEAQRVAEQVSLARRQPGVFYLRMQRAAARNNHEELMQAAGEYESALGRNPNSARLRATALLELGRRDEAAAACRDSLRCDPGDIDVLRQFVLARRPDDALELTALVSAAPDPVQAATALANAIARYADSTSIRVLAEFVDQKAAGTPDAASIHGLLAEAELDDPAAARWYLQALQQESDPAERSGRFWKYLAFMRQRGLTVEAFRSAPDAREAFANLANDEDEIVSSLEPDVLRSLLVEYEQRNGQEDPCWWLHTGNLAAGDGDDNRAIECYERGLARDKDEDESDSRWMLESQLTDALIRVGRWRDAWSRAADDDDQRESIADQLREAGRFHELAELADLWRESDPQQPLADYYAAAVALESGETAEAERLISHGESMLDKDDEAYQRSWFRALRVSTWLKGEDPLDHYGAIAEQPELLQPFVWQMCRAGRRSAVIELVDRLRTNKPQSPDAWYWAVHLRWEARDNAGAAAVLDELPRDVRDRLEASQRAAIDEYRLRCRLRSNRFDEALTLAGTLSREANDPRWLLVANAAAGRGEEVRALFPRLSAYRSNSIYTDEDAGPFLLGAECASLREAWPPWFPYGGTAGWLALLREPCPVDAVALATLVEISSGTTTHVAELAHPLDLDLRTLVVVCGEERFAVTCSSAPFPGDKTVQADGFKDDAAAEALRRHIAWISISPISQSVPRAGQDDGHVAALELLRQLSIGRLLAIYNPDQQQLVPGGADLNRLLSPDSGLDAWNDAGENVWLWRNPGGQDPESAVVDRIHRRLTAAGLELWRNGEQPFQASLRFTDRFCGEHIDVRVERTRPSSWSGFEYEGRVLYDSQLVPWIKEGELVRFSEYNVIDWADSDDAATAREEAEHWWQQFRENIKADISSSEKTDADHPGN